MKKSVSKILALALSVGVVFALAGCSNSKSSSGSSKKGIVIGVLQKNLSDSFQEKLNSAVTDELTSLKTQGKISNFINLNGNSDVQTQLNEANDLIAKKVNAIIMAAQDAN